MTPTSREFPRFAIEATVELTTTHGKTNGRATNVSRGGLAATVERPIAVGETVNVQLALVFDRDTYSEPLDLQARVVWCTQIATTYQLGMAFLPLDDEQRAYLGMFLRYLEEGDARRAQAEAAGHPDDERDLFS